MQCGAVWRKRALFLLTSPPCVCSELRISTFELIKLHIHEARHLNQLLPSGSCACYDTKDSHITGNEHMEAAQTRSFLPWGDLIHKHQVKIHHWVSVNIPISRTIVKRGSRANAHSVTRLKRGQASSDWLVQGPRRLVVRIVHGRM
jgi:hypothetical protein